ncbi:MULTISPECIES: DUF4258 domain-containing protein [Bacillus]|uniref:DUF4258 domain-containing protein n=1 Tax=Bacillus glycinifermentans TaxID=1664069 RepID=A0AAJ3YY38_9BACI|nr:MULTISPECIES: DUF4258 domain-containing protein [Bacillus]MDU0072080.1 DUF4258 domain-containing protein [Bacillus sp. IG6]MED8019661.1 DUF4258 domain-containing protein [Bacillus glycinifermentans]NUJ16845.1 DUF4258 domain-containing protein [Bacillus glycinifermentans]QAT65236.1 DUF4258 domain-containing protein [Bacillus glycinifermentans]WKB79216.1 DUF4258 domain-containing protein [Bacillus glycinifermentans]
MLKSSKKLIFSLTAFVMFFSVIGTSVAEAIQSTPEKEITQPENQTNLSNKELLDLDIDDLIKDKKLVSYIEDENPSPTTTEVNKAEKKIEENLTESDILIDDETLAYIDTINPDIDLDSLDQMDKDIDEEQFTEVKGQFAGLAVRLLLAQTKSLLKKFGFKAVKVSFHLVVRMVQRNISPGDVLDALRKGKKYYDPKYKSTVYYYKGVAVAKKGGTLTTTYRSKTPKKRWK